MKSDSQKAWLTSESYDVIIITGSGCPALCWGWWQGALCKASGQTNQKTKFQYLLIIRYPLPTTSRLRMHKLLAYSAKKGNNVSSHLKGNSLPVNLSDYIREQRKHKIEFQSF